MVLSPCPCPSGLVSTSLTLNCGCLAVQATLQGLLAPIPQDLFMVLMKAMDSLGKMQFKHTHTTVPTPRAHAQFPQVPRNRHLHHKLYSNFFFLNYVCIYFYFFSRLSAQHGARTHNPQIESRALPSEPGTSVQSLFEGFMTFC